MDVFKSIVSDHRRVEEVFQQLADAEGDECVDVVMQLRDLLVPHMVAEQQVVYPLLEDIEDEGAHDMHMEAEEEHHVANLVLNELLNLSPDDSHYKAKCTVLQEIVQHHVEEEESEMLPMLQQHISKRRAQDVGKAFYEAKGRVLSSTQERRAA